ncbi:hypothetical protein BHE74_00021081, partial [Ensete ventricosum]
ALQPAPFAGAALQASVPAGGCCPFGLAVADRARRRCPCRLLPRQAALPLRVAAAPSGAGLPYGLALAAADRGMAVGGMPFMGAGHGWQPLLLTAFAVKMQQECVERFYAIKSHHTWFKTNPSHENHGSDTTVGKPQ